MVFGLQQIPELLSVSGGRTRAHFRDLHATTVFAARVGASANGPNAARALITFLYEVKHRMGCRQEMVATPLCWPRSQGRSHVPEATGDIQ